MEKFEVNGTLKDLSVDYTTGSQTLSFALKSDFRPAYDEFKGKDLTIEIRRYRECRSNDANALMWHCIGEIARATHQDKDEVYKQELINHGLFAYIAVREKDVENVINQYRACDVIDGYIEVGNDKKEKCVQLRCYYGSSTYNTKEFSDLLDGIIEDMKDLGLETPTSKEMRSALDAWEKHNNKQSE